MTGVAKVPLAELGPVHGVVEQRRRPVVVADVVLVPVASTADARSVHRLGPTPVTRSPPRGR